MKYLKKFELYEESFSNIKENLWKLGWELKPDKYNQDKFHMYYGQYNIEFYADIETKIYYLSFEIYNEEVFMGSVTENLYFAFDENTDILNFEVLKKYLNIILEFVQNCNEIIPVLDENNIDFPSFYDINHLDMIEDFNKECSELREEYGYLWTGKDMGLL